MKRTALNLTISLLAFACGLSVATVWKWKTVKPERKVIEATPAPQNETSAATVIPEPAPTRDVIFGRDGLRIVEQEVQLKSERLRYKSMLHILRLWVRRIMTFANLTSA